MIEDKNLMAETPARDVADVLSETIEFYRERPVVNSDARSPLSSELGSNEAAHLVSVLRMAKENIGGLTQELQVAREALEATVAALDKMHKCSIVGAREGYSQPELWADALYESHGDAHRALKRARAALTLPATGKVRK